MPPDARSLTEAHRSAAPRLYFALVGATPAVTPHGIDRFASWLEAGYAGEMHYLPDRRDLNRSFPGNEGGSLAAQLAHCFLTNVIERCTLGIDMHTAAVHRYNLPQIRIASGSPYLVELAMAFGAPIIVESPLRPGSMRALAAEREVPMLLLEAGEALRFDRYSIGVGAAGVLRVANATMERAIRVISLERGHDPRDFTLVCFGGARAMHAADLARDLRLLVRERLVAGDTNEQTVAFIVARYGEYVLLKPTLKGANIVLWVAGPLMLLGGLGIGAAYLRKRARVAGPQALSDDEKARLDKILNG